jgi:hypothetical protein
MINFKVELLTDVCSEERKFLRIEVVDVQLRRALGIQVLDASTTLLHENPRVLPCAQYNMLHRSPYIVWTRLFLHY